MRSSAKSFVVLCSICLVVALLLSAVNFFTAPVIEAAQNAEVLKGLSEVYPSAEKFIKLDLTGYAGLPTEITEAYSADGVGGYVVKLETKGFEAGLVILVGIDSLGKVTGSKAVSHGETPTYGGAQLSGGYPSKFNGVTLESVDSVDTVGGVTMTTSAYKNAVRLALGAAAIFGGGSFDSRTEEEIKLDNALPSAEEKFEPVFITEKIEGLTGLYKATNGKGHVLVYGEDYVGVDENGKLVGDPTSEYASSAEADIGKLLSVTLTELDLDSYEGISKYVETVAVTSSGNYVVTVGAKGYDADQKYSPTKALIKIKLCIDKTGTVISVMTVSHNESVNVGDVCAKPDYYNGFIGTNNETVDGVDTVTGATITTKAYRTAVKNAISAVVIIAGADSQ